MGEPVRVAVDHRRRALEDDRDLEARRALFEVPQGPRRDGRQVDCVAPDGQVPRLRAGDVEQVFDELDHPLDLALDPRQKERARLVVFGPRHDRLDHQLDGRQRRTQFVRHAADEVAARSLEFRHTGFVGGDEDGAVAAVERERRHGNGARRPAEADRDRTARRMAGQSVAHAAVHVERRDQFDDRAPDRGPLADIEDRACRRVERRDLAARVDRDDADRDRPHQLLETAVLDRIRGLRPGRTPRVAPRNPSRREIAADGAGCDGGHLERDRVAVGHALNMYPRLRTVMMWRGLFGSISIFSRSQRTCTLIVWCSPSKS